MGGGTGSLVLLDRGGRAVKRFRVSSGAVTIGRAAHCDIRVMHPAADAHHATVVMHNHQAILRSVCPDGTSVNGAPVSVWRLRHGDTLLVAGQRLRWSQDGGAGGAAAGGGQAVILKRGRSTKSSRRASAAVTSHNRLKLQLDAVHRASMPATATSAGKQVAVVQPQRRDNVQAVSSKEESRRSSTPNINATTKASLWIESRKSSPRGSTAARCPLRLAVLKKQAVMKIHDPTTIDHTKQAAIMLMTGHSPKLRSPSLVVNKTTPGRKTPNNQGRKPSRGSKSTPKSSRGTINSSRSSYTSAGRNTRGSNAPSVYEICDSPAASTSRQSTRVSVAQSSPLLGSPRKSAMKDPKRQSRKNESIKFDLSNLENNDADMDKSNNEVSDSELTLHYSDTSNGKSPSPRRSIHSRSSKILQTTLGKTIEYSKSESTLTPDSPRSRMSLRGSLIVQNALENSKQNSRNRTTSGDQSNTTVASGFRTRTLSPRKSNLESYSIVDLVSIDSNESGKTSVYSSADSVNNSTVTYGTPTANSERKSTRQSRLTIQSRSTLGTSLLGSSTPYVAKNNRSKRSNSSPNISSVNVTKSSISTRRSKSVTTPENRHISVNSTRISRASKCRSRINDSDLLLISPTENSSPKSSRRASKSDKSTATVKNNSRASNRTVTLNDSEIDNSGLVTPENRHSPVEVGTPVLSIQSLLNSSQSSLNSTRSQRKGRSSTSKRKTIAAELHVEPKRNRRSLHSLSLNIPARKSLRLSSDESPLPDEEIVTPKSAVKLVQEAVKNKHSSAKKPQSKRSIIDNLNESDIVKLLFNSPVKRKLSQSMTEFSRKHLSDDEDQAPRKPTRNTVALTNRTLDNSLLENSIDFTEAFVSPLSTPGNSPNLSTVKLFRKNTPQNDLSNVKGVKSSPRSRKSVKSDLTNVSGIKKVFTKSPKNRLSDVRGVKQMFAPSPNNDLRRVSGVKTLFLQKSPKNEYSDVRGVKALFTRSSPRNDLRNVSGVKKTFAKGPKNDLSDVRGVKNMYGRKKRQTDYNNVSGVEDLFNESFNSNKGTSTDNLFDQLIEKPPIKAVYSKSFIKKQAKTKTRTAKSLHSSIDAITNNVEKWLEQELQKRLLEKSAMRRARELQNLATDTLEGAEPIRTSRSRNSTMMKSLVDAVTRKQSASDVYSAHTLPIKKRSFVEKSLDKSVNKSNRLPIKKRIVVHSTPVKGRYNMTMNASELGRVSPIVADKTKESRDNSISVQIEAKLSPKPKTPGGRRGTKQLPEVIQEVESPAKVSPKKTRGKAAKASPELKNTRQTRRTIKSDKTASPNVRKRRTSLVIARKSPVAKPKPAKKNDVVPKVVESPKKTRNTRKQAEIKVASPKRNSRTKVRRSSVVVTKLSPKMKPQTKRGGRITEQKSLETSSEKITKTRKNASNSKTESKPVATRRGRKTVEEVKSPKTRKGKIETIPKTPEKPVTKRGKKAAPEIEAPITRGRRNALIEKSPEKPVARSKRGQNSSNTELSKRGRKTESKPNQSKTKQKTESPKNTTTKTRGKTLKSQSSTQSEPTTRGRKATDNANKTEVQTRTRKTTKEPTPKKLAKSKTVEEKKTRGKKSEEEKQNKSLVKTRRVRNVSNVTKEPTPKKPVTSKILQEKKTRGRKSEEEKQNKSQVKTRRMRNVSNVSEAPAAGKKASSKQVEEKPQRGGRKRKIDELPDTTKQPAKKSRKSVEVAPPAPRRAPRRAGRNTTVNKLAGVVEKPTGRTRRR